MLDCKATNMANVVENMKHEKSQIQVPKYISHAFLYGSFGVLVAYS